jgi:hypothetical protein
LTGDPYQQRQERVGCERRRTNLRRLASAHGLRSSHRRLNHRASPLAILWSNAWLACVSPNLSPRSRRQGLPCFACSRLHIHQPAPARSVESANGIGGRYRSWITYVISLHRNGLRRPRNFAIAIECRATQACAKRRWHIFGHTPTFHCWRASIGCARC